MVPDTIKRGRFYVDLFIDGNLSRELNEMSLSVRKRLR